MEIRPEIATIVPTTSAGTVSEQALDLRRERVRSIYTKVLSKAGPQCARELCRAYFAVPGLDMNALERDSVKVAVSTKEPIRFERVVLPGKRRPPCGSNIKA